MNVPTRSPSPVVAAFAVLCVALGVAFRLVAVEDMEWKADAQLAWSYAETVGRTASWPWTGMRSGVGTPNPGMSIWCFVGLARAVGARDPLDLARAIQGANALALVALLAFAFTRAPGEREGWLWAAALAAVNPGDVQLQRKIWAQSMLPLLGMAFLWAWWHRRRPLGAFAWGAVGAALGQIHMSGFFHAAAVAIFTWLSHRRGDPDGDRRPVRWGWWLAGSLAAAWPLVPWIRLGLSAPGGAPRTSLAAAGEFGFWQHWLFSALGLGPWWSLSGDDFLAWLREPTLGGSATHLVGALYAVAVLACAAAILAGVRSLRAWPDWRERLLGGGSTRLLLSAALVGHGIIATASLVRSHRHYLIVMFPLVQLWLARSALATRRGRALLAAVACAHAALAASFLGFVRERGGSPRGDYGVSWRAQREKRSP
jgi:hypothetical protein